MKFGKSFVAIFVGCLVMSGCARTASVDPGPDEFAVLPNAALVEPANYTDLPEPGTFFTSDELGKPILCTRDLDGRFHAFLNNFFSIFIHQYRLYTR